jgi:hypothetical protein
MNFDFLRSRHALVAMLVIGAFGAWHYVAPMPFGDRADANVWFLLTTGWFAVAAYIALALYAARRAAHRLRLTPEFGWEAKLPALEQAQSQLTELQNRIIRREIAGKANIKKAARDIVTTAGVARVLRIDVVKDDRAIGLMRLDVTPRNALGRMASWLSAHVWYGIAAALLVWFHGGGRSDTTMGLVLNALSYFVIGSGLLGAFFWAFGPTWLTRAERELTIEKALGLCEHFARKVRAAQEALTNAPQRRELALAEASNLEQQVTEAKDAKGDSKDKKLAKAVKAAEKDLKAAKGAVKAADKEMASLPGDIKILTGQQRLVQREARRLNRYRTLLRGWRLFHVPCSVVLLALVAVHVISIYYY